MSALRLDPNAIGVDVSWHFGTDRRADTIRIPRTEWAARLAHYGFEAALISDSGADLNSVDFADVGNWAKGATRKGRNFVVRQLHRPNADTPVAFGVYRQRSGSGETDTLGQPLARVRRGPGAYAEAVPPEGETTFADSDAAAVAEQMARLANQRLVNVVNADISRTLLAIGEGLGWIARRPVYGGSYFLGKDVAPRFIELLRWLQKRTEENERGEQFRSQVQEVFPSPLALATWGDSAEDAFENDIERLLQQLDEMRTDGRMRDTTKVKRAEEADRLIAKAETYRMFLKDRADTLSARLEKIRNDFRAAVDANLADAQDGFDAIDAALAPKKAKRVRRAKPEPQQPAVIQAPPDYTPVDWNDIDAAFDVA